MAVSEVKFIDNKMEVIDHADSVIDATLLECAAEIVAQTVRNHDTFPRVDTGQLKNSFRAEVFKKPDGFEAVIGSPLERALWSEFGTGEYAVEGNGRKGGWAYTDKKTGERVWTRGMRPSRAFKRAYDTKRPIVEKRLRDKLSAELGG